MDKVLSKAFDLLRFPLAILVVFLHIDNAPKISVWGHDWNWNEGLALYEMTIILVDTIAKIAVPCFFFISGYLFFIRIKVFTVAVYKDKITRRIRSLLVPYLIWNLLAVAYLYATQGIMPDSFARVFLAPANFPLWFLRDLIIMVVASPVIYCIAKYAKSIGLIVMTVLYVSDVIPVLVYCLFSSVYFFYLGCYCSQRRGFAKAIKGNLHVLCMSASVLFWAAIVLYGYVIGKYVLLAFLITGTFCSISIGCRFVEKGIKVMPVLVASSFFIYLSHKLGATYIAKVLFTVLPDNYYVLTLRFLVAPFVAVLMCVAVFALWQKYSPKTLSFVIGRK